MIAHPWLPLLLPFPLHNGEVTTYSGDPCGVCIPPRGGESPTERPPAASGLDGGPRQARQQASAGPSPPQLMEVAVRCTHPNCSCDCFSPSKEAMRNCEKCKHGWVIHALSKLGDGGFRRHLPLELVQAHDVAALVLYGAQALPIRLKILLDRLLSVLRQDDVAALLAGFGWTYEDYIRGYILQDPAGQVLDKWNLVGRDEEPLILQQFLRFGETKAIAAQLLLLDESCSVEAKSHLLPTSCPKQMNSPISPPPQLSSSNNSPLSAVISPLNKLQNMQPYDYRHQQQQQQPPPAQPLQRQEHSPETPRSSMDSLSLATPTSSSPLMASSSMNALVPTISSVSASTPPSHLQQVSSAPSYHNSDLSATDGGSEEDTNGAINLSQTAHSNLRGGSNSMDSVFAARKVKHLRKSANPMKRRWNPLMLSTLATNPTTGKKRVQCHACLKTFCDKGALKIHFSAVHLREMHKCTIEGCNMKFSSRRSRNRHSANPNPKLHTPNIRRKMNPHDGRTALPYPVLPTGPLINYNNNLLPSFPDGISSYLGDVNIKADSVSSYTSSADDISMPYILPPPTMNAYKPNECTALALTKKPKIVNYCKENNELGTDGEEGMNLSTKDDQSSLTKGVSKRKSFNPTKCAVTTTSDEDVSYLSTDGTTSDDTCIEDNGALDSKSDDSDFLDDDSKDEDLDRFRIESLTKRIKCDNPEKSPLSPSTKPTAHDNSSNVVKEESHNNSNNNISVKKDFSVNSLDLSKKSENSQVKPSPPTSPIDKLGENPLRRLEFLSMGTFSSSLMVSSDDSPPILLHPPPSQSLPHHHTLPPYTSSGTSSGVSYHAPGLGLGTSVADTVTTTSLPAVVPSTTITNNNGDSSSDMDRLSLVPLYRESSLVGSMDIPVDKENPRRCTACGKIFQNHFGVKTHYQNVHLKLMHQCTVEGCNAAFPSKRSRDRHSANLNLHRKLLSTSSDKSHYFEKTLYSSFTHHPSSATAAAAMRDDFLSRFYDPAALNYAAAAELYQHHRGSTGPLDFTNSLLSPFHPTATMLGYGGGQTSPASSGTTPSPRPVPTFSEELSIDSGDGCYSCQLCHKKFHESVVLREHYEKSHFHELLRCPAEGCSRLYLTHKARDACCHHLAK